MTPPVSGGFLASARFSASHPVLGSQNFHIDSGHGKESMDHGNPWHGCHGNRSSKKKVNLPAVVFLETSSVSGIMCCDFFMVKLRCLSRKNGKTGMLGHPEVYVGCYGF